MTPDPASDRRFMAAALRLGRSGLGLTWPNPSVACLIVREGASGPVVVGRGVTARGGRPHAEVLALAEAGEAARGATAYVTLEPCSHIGKTGPCADALVEAGIARVVCALGDPDPRVAGRGFARLREAGVAVTEAVLPETAAHDHIGHVTRIREGRPAVMLKLALSADGKTGRAGERVAITGPETQARVHMMRAMSDAIAVGIGTVLADDPLLTVRLPGLAERSPIRVVFDADLRLPVASHLVRTAREVPVHVMCGWAAPSARAEALRAAGVVVHPVTPPFLGGPGVNLAIALRELTKLGITRLMLEGGLTLAKAFLERDMVDEAVLIESPNLIGPAGLAARGPGVLDAWITTERFDVTESSRIGPDHWVRHTRRRH